MVVANPKGGSQLPGSDELSAAESLAEPQSHTLNIGHGGSKRPKQKVVDIAVICSSEQQQVLVHI